MKSANPCCVIPKKRYHHRKYFSSRVSHARMCDMVGPCNCMLLMFCRNTAGGLYSQMQILQGSFSQITEQANTAQPQTTYKKYRDKGAAVRRLGGERRLFSLEDSFKVRRKQLRCAADLITRVCSKDLLQK